MLLCVITLQDGYDSDDARPRQPRVRQLSNYGKALLKAFECGGGTAKRRLLRVQSTGAWLLWPVCQGVQEHLSAHLRPTVLW